MTEPIHGPEVHTQKLVSQARARRFVSQNGRGYLAVGILDAAGKPVDPDAGTVADDGQTKPRQFFSGTNARQFQDLR